jgi:hypothetical protein
LLLLSSLMYYLTTERNRLARRGAVTCMQYFSSNLLSPSLTHAFT